MYSPSSSRILTNPFMHFLKLLQFVNLEGNTSEQRNKFIIVNRKKIIKINLLTFLKSINWPL